MTGTVLQFLLAAFALVVMVWVELTDIVRLLCPADWKRLSAWLKRAIQVVAVFVATGCIVDPLIPGTANLTIHAPSAIPMTLDTLVVETIPVGLLGEAGGERTCYDVFDARGISQVTVKLGLLETRVKLRVFDKSAPSRSIITESVYVSPFVRSQLTTKVVHF